MTQGPLWRQMKGAPRLQAAAVTRASIPGGAGVYAWYRDGEAVYAGRAAGTRGLKSRIWAHLATTPDLSRSAFRRNVCDHLGIADTSITKQRPTRMTASDVEPVNAWIRDLEVGWLEFPTTEEALSFEERLLAEWRPPLNRR